MAAASGYGIWASFVPAYAGAVALFFVAERYRLPLLVPLCVGAGALLGHLSTAYQASANRFAIVRGSGVLPFSRTGRCKLNDGRWEEGLRLAQRYVILQRYDDAERWAERLEASGPPRPGAGHYGVGAQLLAANQPERARPHLEAAHRADPSEPLVEYTLGQALLKSGRAAEAIPHLRRGFESGAEIPRGGYELAEALHATGDLPGAAAVVGRVRLAETEDVEVWLRLGRIAHAGAGAGDRRAVLPSRCRNASGAGQHARSSTG